MGIDLIAGRKSKKTKRTALKSDDIYLKLLLKLYRFLVRTGSKFSGVILKRLFMSTNKGPLLLSRLISFVKGKEDKIAVAFGCITDDTRVYDMPALKVAALRFTDTARARIVQGGGECLTSISLLLSLPSDRTRFFLGAP